MAPKSNTLPNKICRIYLWIERNQPKLAECIKDLCLEGVLSPNRNVNGVTFLLPNQSTIDKIYEETYGPGGNADNAVKIILAHIIPDYLPDVNAFKKHSKIGNKLNFALPSVSESSVNTVTFGDNTFTITNIPEFHSMPNRNLALWKVAAGEVPMSGERITHNKNGNTKKKSVKGGDGNSCSGDPKCLQTSFRAIFANFVELKYIEQYISKLGINKRDPFLYAINRLLDELQRADNKEEYNKVKIILDENHIVTFYLLLEPYKSQKEFLISDEIFTQDLLEDLYKSINQGTMGEITSETAKYTKMLYSDLDTDKLIEIKTIANKYRYELSDDANFFNLRNDILHIYAHLELENKLSCITDIFHECLYKHYKTDNNKYKRLWQDELRFIIKEKLRLMNAEFEIPIKTNNFNMLCNLLKLQFPGNNYTCELQIMNECDYKLSICIRDKLLVIKHFLLSPNFLYVLNIPLPHSDKPYACQTARTETPFINREVVITTKTNTQPTTKKVRDIVIEQETEDIEVEEVPVQKQQRQQPYQLRDDSYYREREREERPREFIIEKREIEDVRVVENDDNN